MPIPAGPGTLVGTYRPGTLPTTSVYVELDGWAATALDGYGTEWWLTKVEGWRDRPAMRVASTPRQADHGSYDAPSYLDSRIVTVEGTAIATSEANAYLSADIVASVCADPSALYPLVVAEPGRPIRRAMVRLNDATKVSSPYGIDSTAFDWSLQLRAPDPRRYAATDTVTTLTLPIGAGTGLTLPITVPITLPTTVAANRATVVNDGTFATRPVVTFYGPVTDPVIANMTAGLNLAFDLDLLAGETLAVDFDARSVILNRTVSRAYAIVPGSAWWELAPGNTDVQYAAGAGTGPAILTYASAWI